MEEKTEAVKGEETTVGLTMNYNPFSFISCQEDALVLAGCISHGLDADVIKKSGDLFATARAMLLDACVCLLYRQGGDSMSMQGLVDLLQNDISHNEDQDMPSIKAAYDKIEADGATVEEDLGLKRYRMFQAIAYGETAISVELDLYAKLSAMVDRPLVGWTCKPNRYASDSHGDALFMRCLTAPMIRSPGLAD